MVVSCKVLKYFYKYIVIVPLAFLSCSEPSSTEVEPFEQLQLPTIVSTDADGATTIISTSDSLSHSHIASIASDHAEETEEEATEIDLGYLAPEGHQHSAAFLQRTSSLISIGYDGLVMANFIQ